MDNADIPDTTYQLGYVLAILDRQQELYLNVVLTTIFEINSVNVTATGRNHGRHPRQCALTVLQTHSYR